MIIIFKQMTKFKYFLQFNFLFIILIVCRLNRLLYQLIVYLNINEKVGVRIILNNVRLISKLLIKVIIIKKRNKKIRVEILNISKFLTCFQL